MISRSVGLEIGGAVGIPLFLCRTLSLTLYAFGLAESIAPFWPAGWGPPPIQLLAAGVILIATAVAGKSADLSLKLQLPIMVAVAASLIALAIGVLSGGLQQPELTPHFERSAPGGFWFVFAVFFPAVTGFGVGIGMSGDLKDPKKSIPKGTILAVITGTIVYLSILTLLSLSAKVNGTDLAGIDPSAPPVWTKIAFLGAVLVYPGMWGAILSSAIGSILGGPRVLQALARDRLAPSFLGRTSKTGQPTIATWITGAIALAAVSLGDLNAVGRWVTIFFLTLYIVINLSAALEKIVGDISYRPTINVPWIISLLGALGGFLVMFLINPLACIVAVTIELALYLFLRRRALRASWGDVRAGMWSAIARFALINLQKKERHARNWRPNILLFSANPLQRMMLTRMANWFNQNRGIVTVCQTIEGEVEKNIGDIRTNLRKMREEFRLQQVQAFPEVHVTQDFASGILGVVQANGFAGMQSNTVMFGWPEDTGKIIRLIRMVRAITSIKRNTLLASLPPSLNVNPEGKIDVWWRGMEHNGALMLMLAHLLTLNPAWRRTVLYVRSIVDTDRDRRVMEEKISSMMEEARISAIADVVVKEENTSYIEMIHAASADAEIVFIGLGLPEPEDEQEFAERLRLMVSGLPAVIMVRGAESLIGQLIE
ncbi:amino acid permease [bacterium]|nr:amino acid permease [bacterium]